MKKVLIVLISICGLWLLNGCGSTTTTTPPPVATHYSVTSGTPAPVAGTAVNFTVTALDDKNSPVATYSGTVHFTSSDAQAVLPASATITNGTGTGSITLETAGNQTVTATGTDSLTGTSNGVTVSAGPATQLSVSAASSSTLTGAKFQFTVTAQDVFKNTATSYAGTVHFTSSDTSAQVVLPANSPLTSGTGNFSAVLQTVGSESIIATDTVTPSITGKLSSIAVTAPAALGITNGTLPDGAAGILYHEVCTYRRPCSSLNPLDATGGVPPYSWSWAAAPGSSLPPGLGISNVFHCQVRNQSIPCAAIIGTPSAAATYNVVLTVTDSATPAGQLSHTLPLTIIPKLVVTSGTPPDGTIGTPYNFTFTTSGGKPPITWSFQSGPLPAGLSLDPNTGAVTGTPTTTALTNATVVATDSGGQQQHAFAALDVAVNPPAVNNAELNGQYAFLFQGFDGSPVFFQGQPVNIVGSFTADGAGNLIGGLEDINDGNANAPVSSTFVGTYEIYSDNRGIFKLTASPGGADLGTFRFAVGSISGGVASKARFFEFDARGTRGGGLIEKQDPTAFSTAKITGDYAFGVSSVIRATSSAIANFGAAGRFTASAGTISSGTIDEDSDGTITSNAALTGTYSVAATGRGTMTLNVAGTANPVNLVFYVVSSDQLLVQSSDGQQSIGFSSYFAGTMLHQSGAGTFSNSSLNASSVIALQGVNSGGNDVVLGVLSIPTAGNFTLVGDENNLGALAALNQAGTYTVTSNGRVTITGTPKPMVFYLLAADQGFVVGTDNNASTGFFEPQTGGSFSVASANGNFFFGPSTPGNTFANSHDSGVETYDGAGSAAGTIDSMTSNAGLALGIQTYTEAYTIAMSGRGTMTTSAFIFYMISPSKFVRMDGGVGVSNATITVGEK
jgi:hypothetical protein